MGSFGNKYRFPGPIPDIWVARWLPGYLWPTVRAEIHYCRAGEGGVTSIAIPKVLVNENG